MTIGSVSDSSRTFLSSLDVTDVEDPSVTAMGVMIITLSVSASVSTNDSSSSI